MENNNPSSDQPVLSEAALDAAANPQPPRKSPKDMSFLELLHEYAGDFSKKEKLVRSILQKAEEGDSAAIKILEKAYEENRYSENQKLSLSDEQWKNIILLAADRIRGQRESQIT